MKFIVPLLILFMNFGCDSNSPEEEVPGDLYYHWFKLGSFYGHPDSIFQEYLRVKDSLGFEAMMREDSSGTLYLKMLEDNDLLRNPFIFMKKDNGHVLTLFLDSADYQRFVAFSYQELLDNNQKVRIKANIDSITGKTYVCRSLNSVELIEGQTLVGQGKFKIEEYR